MAEAYGEKRQANKDLAKVKGKKVAEAVETEEPSAEEDGQNTQINAEDVHNFNKQLSKLAKANTHASEALSAAKSILHKWENKK